jgi:hypothetical protein
MFLYIYLANQDNFYISPTTGAPKEESSPENDNYLIVRSLKNKEGV